jgi:hypothetical protein
MNKVVLLDYYHPYAGLCNQLYLITNHIHSAFVKGLKIYIHKVNIDIFKKNRIPAEEFFDLKATADNIKRLTGRDIILFEKPTDNFIITKLCIYPVSSIEILSCLEFQKRFTSLVPKMKYNGIHFRLELDPIIHYLFNRNCYNDFMDRCNNSTLDPKFTNRFVKLPEVKRYIDNLLEQYFNFINKIGFGRTFFISTSIGKNNINDCLKPTLKRLTDFIQSNGTYFQNTDDYFTHRELNALVDLITLRNSEKMIVFEGSSFSEGYCLKVNSNKEYHVIYGITDKLSDELYKSLSDDTVLCK